MSGKDLFNKKKRYFKKEHLKSNQLILIYMTEET